MAKHDIMHFFLVPCYLCYSAKKQPARKHCKLESLRERRPPWPRQIITLMLPTVKMLSLGCERLLTPLKKKKKKKRFWIITFTTIWVCYHYYGVFCSFTHLTIPRSPPKFNQFFLVLLRNRP